MFLYSMRSIKYQKIIFWTSDPPCGLNWYSHHTSRTKLATAESMYSTAEGVSSNNMNKRYSSGLVDTLLLNNGYGMRVLDKIKKKREEKKKKPKKNKRYFEDTCDHAILKLPYLNDVTSRKYRDAVRHSGLPIKIVETPGQRLRDLLTDSRPLDKVVCITNNCKACDALTSGNCMSKDCIPIPHSLYQAGLQG